MVVSAPISSITGPALGNLCSRSSIFLFGADFRCTNYDVLTTLVKGDCLTLERLFRRSDEETVYHVEDVCNSFLVMNAS